MGSLQGAVPHLQGSVLWDAVPRPAKNPFENGFLDLPKLLEMGMMYPTASATMSPSKENNAASHSCEHGSTRHYFPCLSFGQGRWGSELHKRGKGRRLDDPSKRLSKTAFDAQNKRFPQTKAFPCEGRGTAIAVDE